MNVACLLEHTASEHAHRPALFVDEAVVSYDDLRNRAAIAAEVLRQRGVERGERVALMLPNGPGFVAAYFGALQLGAIVVPLNVLLRGPEVADRLARSTPRLLVVDETCDPGLAVVAGAEDVEVLRLEESAFARTARRYEVVERGDGDAAVLLFTSGTSGAPKGAILTHRGIRTAARNAATALALRPEDVILGAAPFSHVLGQATGILSTVLTGAAIAVVPRFDASETLRFMTETGTTILLGVPTICITLCQAAREADTLPPIRVAHVGGAPVPLEVAREFERTFAGAEVREGYGLTELSGIATTYVPGEERRPGSVGRPLGGTELRIVSLTGEPLPPNEIGEVHFRGPSVIPGYWNDEIATRAALSPDGWLSTGDMGFVDDAGYLFLVDRKKEMIIRGGYNVFPREVEEALYEHHDVLEAAVVGLPDDVLGEEVVAIVALRPGATSTPEALQAFVKERVAAYKYPRHVIVVDELPKGPTGKILKRELDPVRLVREQARNQVT